jgi:hypothetical protein
MVVECVVRPSVLRGWMHNGPAEIERLFHRAFADDRVGKKRSEWFQASAGLRGFVARVRELGPVRGSLWAISWVKRLGEREGFHREPWGRWDGWPFKRRAALHEVLAELRKPLADAKRAEIRGAALARRPLYVSILEAA